MPTRLVKKRIWIEQELLGQVLAGGVVPNRGLRAALLVELERPRFSP